jgi:hypothetical protein
MGQKFHQYQQNKQSPQLTEHKTSNHLNSLNTKQTITSTHWTQNKQSPQLTEHKTNNHLNSLNTKQTITSTHWTQNKQSPQLTEHKTNNHLNSLNTKETTTFDVGNSGPGFGQSQTCDGVKSNNRIPTLPSW